MSDAKISLGYDLNELRADEAKVLTASRETGKKAAAAMAAGSKEGGIGGSMGAMASQALVAGAGMLALRETFNSFDRLNDLAVRFDTDAESMQRLAAMAKMSGTDVETLAKGEQKLIQNLADAEENPNLAKALKTLGLDARALRAASPEEAIMLLRDGFEKANGSGEGYAAVLDLIGKSGGELIPLLRATREELQAVADVKIVSNDDVARIAAFNDMVDQSTMTLKGWVATAAVGISDHMAAIGNTIQTLFGDNFTSLDESYQAMKQLKEEAKAEAEAQRQSAAAAREAAAAKKEQAAAEAFRKKEKEDFAKQGPIMDQIAALGQQLSFEEKIALAEQEIATAKKAYHDAPAAGVNARQVELAALKDQLKAEEMLVKLKKEQTALSNDIAQARINEMRAHLRGPAADRAQKDLNLKKEEERLIGMGMKPEEAHAEAKRRQRASDRAGTIDGRAKDVSHWGLDAHGPSALDAAKARNAMPWADTHPGLGLLPHRGPAAAAAAAANAHANKAETKTDPVFGKLVESMDRVEKAVERLGD
jgi:hypothetical protein